METVVQLHSGTFSLINNQNHFLIVQPNKGPSGGTVRVAVLELMQHYYPQLCLAVILYSRGEGA